MIKKLISQVKFHVGQYVYVQETDGAFPVVIKTIHDTTIDAYTPPHKSYKIVMGIPLEKLETRVLHKLKIGQAIIALVEGEEVTGNIVYMSKEWVDVQGPFGRHNNVLKANVRPQENQPLPAKH